MWGLHPGVIVLLAAALALSGGTLVVLSLVARNTFVLRADTRKREGEGWRLDQEERFAELRRQFASLQSDVTADLERATGERETATALNARNGKRNKREAEVVQQGPRTRDQVRAERLPTLRPGGLDS